MKLKYLLIPTSLVPTTVLVTSCACFVGYKVTFKDLQGISFSNTKAKRHQHFSVVGNVNPGVRLTFWKIQIGSNTYLAGDDSRVRVTQTSAGAPVNVIIEALLVEDDITITIHCS